MTSCDLLFDAADKIKSKNPKAKPILLEQDSNLGLQWLMMLVNQQPGILTMMADLLLAQSAMDRFQSAVYELAIQAGSTANATPTPANPTIPISRIGPEADHHYSSSPGRTTGTDPGPYSWQTRGPFPLADDDLRLILSPRVL